MMFFSLFVTVRPFLKKPAGNNACQSARDIRVGADCQNNNQLRKDKRNESFNLKKA